MKSHSILLFIALLAILCFSCVKKTNSPSGLKCEFQENPLGMDVIHPRFSWKLNDATRGASQLAYQVLVASKLNLLSEKKADIWNSGKVESNKSHLIPFQGNELESRKKYFWKVKIWNQKGVESTYSQTAHFEMGLLKNSDWQANWIGQHTEPIDKTSDNLGNWIWSSTTAKPNQQVYFRKNFFLPKKQVKEAVLRVTADDIFTVFLNGRYIARANDWKQFYYHEISYFLNGNDNTLGFLAINRDDRTAGLIYSLHILFEDGSEQVILSDETTLSKTEKPGDTWKKVSFDDDAWENTKIIAQYGKGFWDDSVKIVEPRKSVLVRKEFSVTKTVESARIYATGLGGYVMSLNGERVGKDMLTPGWTNYPEKIQYQVYDVTDKLNAGKNAIGTVLGNIWWSSGLGWNGGSFYNDGPLRLLAQLVINYKDETTEYIITDDSWKATYSPVIYNTLYHGEMYDARMEQEGWNEPGFDDSNWNNTVLIEDYKLSKVAQYSPTMQVTDTLKAVSITEPTAGVYVLDFGQNLVGRERLKISGKEGQKIIMRFAELLNDSGTVAQENLRMAKATDVYTCKGEKVEEWAPDFVYHGFRYVQVEGLEEKPTDELLVGEVIHNNAKFIGEFESSNELLNQIWENITWGQRGNMMSVPTDCPQRDERLGWMGDAQIFAPTANYNMHMPNFWSKWVADIVDCQEPDGRVYDVNPAIVVEGPSKPGWGDAVTVTPWMSYLFYGDKKILEDNYDGMKAWVEYMRGQSKNNIYEFGDGDWGGYGDWVAVEPSPTKPIGGIYYYYSTKLLSKIAKILGKEADAEEYASLLPEIANAYQKKYFDPKTNQYEGKTQTANLLPLAVGITPDNLKDVVFENIVENVISHDKHLTTGFLGTAYLLPELSRQGQNELAYEVAIQETYPSWGYMVKKGATTMWELWNSDTERPEGMNSRNHFAYGSVGEWYFGYLAGIQLLEDFPGFKKIKIVPYVPDGLEHAGATYESPYGTIKSYWKKEGKGLGFAITIPANSSAEVHIPISGYSKIMEESNIVFENGEGIKNENISFLRQEEDRGVFDVKSGTYAFKVE